MSEAAKSKHDSHGEEEMCILRNLIPWGTSSVNYTTIIVGYRYIKGNNWWIWFPLKDSSNVRNVYNCTFQSELSLNYVCSI